MHCIPPSTTNTFTTTTSNTTLLLLLLLFLLLRLPPESLLDARLQVRHIRDSLVVNFSIVSFQHVVDLLDQSLLGMGDDFSKV